MEEERDFWRFADVYLRGYFPNLLSQSRLNRRVRALEPETRALQRKLAESLFESFEVYRVLDTTLIPAIVRVRACRKGLFAGQATFWSIGVFCDRPSAGFGAAFFLVSLGQFVGPAAFAAVADLSSLEAAFYVSAAIMEATALIRPTSD